MPSASGVASMSAITRGVVAGLLLAGAVAGAAAFPQLFAAPGSVQTPRFALVPGASRPAIVQARALPVRRLRPRPVVAPVAAAPIVHRAAPAAQAPARVAPKPQPKPSVAHRVARPTPAVPAPAPAPAPAPPSTPAPSAPAPSGPAAASAPPPPVRTIADAQPTTAPPVDQHGHGQHQHGATAATPAVTTAPLGSGHGSSAQQAPPGTAGDDGGDLRHLEAPDPGAA